MSVTRPFVAVAQVRMGIEVEDGKAAARVRVRLLNNAQKKN